MNSIDSLILARLIYLFNQQIKNTKAFKRGIVDDKGEQIKDDLSSEDKESYSMLVRFMFKLKRLIGKVPGGDTQLGTLVASYLALKEEVGGTAIGVGCTNVPIVRKSNVVRRPKFKEYVKLHLDK